MKKIITLFVTVLLLCSPIAAQTAVAPAGSGTQNDPYKIANIENLYWLSQTDSIWNDSLYFIQTADINASETKNWDNGKGFFPIGNSITKFSGSYNGQGHIIDSLTINRPLTYYIGLFGSMSDATIDNLGVTNASIQGNYYVGCLVGCDESSTVNSCYSSGSVSGNSSTGGLVGENYFSLTVTNCYSNASVSGNNHTGGLVGYNYFSIISSCYSTGSVSGYFSVGGLVGSNSSSTINSCYYNSKTSKQSSGIGKVANGQIDVTALSTAQMKQDSSFSGWDFTNTWKIDNNITFPRLVNVNNAPIILQNLPSIIKVNETYTDTIQFVFMDNKKVSIELLTHPEGMTLTEDSIITYTPTRLINDTVGIRVTDSTGLAITYFYNINVIDLDGNGTKTDPYQIGSLNELKQLSQMSNLWDKYFIQTANINASDTKNWDSGKGFLPIGNITTRFSGSYNGQGYIIDRLTINRSLTDYVGLFGYISGATIDNLGMINANIQGHSDVGCLVGVNEDFSIVSSCFSTGLVSGSDQVGGLVGDNSSSSTVINCYSSGSVSGNSSIGGLVGKNDYSLTVTNCYSSGSVSGNIDAGGLVGKNYYTNIISCYYNRETSGQNYGTGTEYHYDFGIGDCCNGQIDVTALTSNEMKESSNFADWDFSTIWGILADSTYPALLGVSNNAPFAFADTLAVAGKTLLNTKILANDCDYETVQKNLCYKIITSPTKGSLINGVYSFDDTVSIGNTDSLIYRIGEYTSNDTLWGNSATIILTKVENTAPILQSVNDTTIDKDTPLTLSLDDVTATDADGDELSLIVTTTDTNCTITETTITPNSGFTGDIALLVSVTDGIDTSKTLTMNLKVDGVISVKEITPMAKEGYGLRIAPTPTRDAGKIVVTSNVNGKAVFTIYTRNETKIATMKRDVFYGKKMSFDWPIISKLDKGIYYIEMKVNGDRKAIARIVKINK